ncbi:MAG: competence/damage-inducible protein A [Halarchaeum sp.]
MDVALLTVGDEVLAGETTNTNAAWLGRALTARGANVRRTVVVPDEEAVIADAVRELSERYDAVLVTGGLGPTPDDVTMAGVAAGLDREVVEHEGATRYVEAEGGYENAERDDALRRLPAGARVLPNAAGVAPGAAVETERARVYVLPGVPSEMKEMFEAVADEFAGTERLVETVHANEPESALVDRIETARERFDVSVGSYPGDGVRLRVSGTDGDAVHAAAQWLRERVER